MNEKVIVQENKRGFKRIRNYFILVCLFVGIIMMFSYVVFILIIKFLAADSYNMINGYVDCWNGCEPSKWFFLYEKSNLYTFFYFWWDFLAGVLVTGLCLFLYYKKLLKKMVTINVTNDKICGILKKDICSVKLFKFFNTIFIFTRNRIHLFPFIIDAESVYKDIKAQNVEQFDFKKASFWQKFSLIIIGSFQVLCRVFVVIILAYLLYMIYLFFFVLVTKLAFWI